MLFQDLDNAIGFYSQLTLMVKDGTYDEHHEPLVQALIYSDDERKRVIPVTGFKNY